LRIGVHGRACIAANGRQAVPIVRESDGGIELAEETWPMKINGVSEEVSVKSEGAIEHAFFT